ncbi:MAG: ABC transporter substrate-binding protein, partial [Candidatus Diapherotrites archaeon]|nr:ABC transporter substrate-binding protein [Candidatus Diapherotrites archaeon]
GIPTKIVFNSSRSNGADGILSVQNINSISDLKGKTIALEKGTPSHFLLLKALDSVGLSGSDVELSSMSPGDAGVAFASGKVEAAVTWEPWLTEAKEKGNGKILVDSTDFPIIVDVWIASDNALKNKKPALQKYVDSWFETIDYLKVNPKESNEIMGKNYGMSGDDFAGFLQTVKLMERPEAVESMKSLPALVEDAERLWKQEKIIESVLPGNEIVSQEFLK